MLIIEQLLYQTDMLYKKVFYKIWIFYKKTRLQG